MKKNDIYLNAQGEELTITSIEGDMVHYDIEDGMGDGECRKDIFEKECTLKTEIFKVKLEQDPIKEVSSEAAGDMFEHRDRICEIVKTWYPDENGDTYSEYSKEDLLELLDAVGKLLFAEGQFYGSTDVEEVLEKQGK